MSRDMELYIQGLTTALNPMMFGWIIGQVLAVSITGFDIYSTIFSFCMVWAMVLSAFLIGSMIANRIIRKRKSLDTWCK